MKTYVRRCGPSTASSATWTGRSTSARGLRRQSWEYYPDPGIVVRTVGAAAAATRHTSMFDDALVDYKQHGTTISSAAPPTSPAAAPSYCTSLSPTASEKTSSSIKSYLIDGYARIVPFHAFGTKYTTHMEMSDYRPEAGVMIAHRSREVDSATGKVFNEGMSSLSKSTLTLRSLFFRRRSGTARHCSRWFSASTTSAPTPLRLCRPIGISKLSSVRQSPPPMPSISLATSVSRWEKPTQPLRSSPRT